jgi:methylenetetrahydrofolate dehydrogenase (NADP+)/methenyltetrahydrofolate cyclohydrolase
MTAKIIDGKIIAQTVRDQISQQVSAYVAKGKRAPCLAVILVGADPASEIYVSRKEKTCGSVGILSQCFRKPADITQSDLLALIDKLNADDSVDGILLQLPLPGHLDKVKCVSAIMAEKDVDGITPVNEGRLVWRYPGLYPCTPLGILKLVESVHKDLSGKVAACVGRSALVGMPTGNLLENAGCTVISLHRESIDCSKWTRQADIVVAAAGHHHLVQADWIKPGATVIDVGIHRTGNSLSGDVNFETVRKVAGAITPVPGGVGPMTIAMLMTNCLKAYEERYLGITTPHQST